MSFKLNKSEQQQLNNLRDEVERKIESFERAKEKDDEALNNALNNALAELMVTLSEIRDFISGVSGRLRDEYDEKSEAWQDGDRGQEVDEFIQQWEDAENIFEDPEIEGPLVEMCLDEYDQQLDDLPIEA